MAKPHILTLALTLTILVVAVSALGYDKSPTDQIQSLAGFKRQFLRTHNEVRLALGEDPLVWDDKVEAYAKQWASERKSDCELVHSNGRYGENIFWGSGVGWTPAQAVMSWVDESQVYDFKANACRGEACGHYTQVVWRDTMRLGCASVVCDNDKGTFITCNYDPAGNYNGERPY